MLCAGERCDLQLFALPARLRGNNGVRFLQAIEGEHVTVEATMGRISADDRHADISYSFRDQVDQREFPHWSVQEPFGPHDDVDLFLRKVRADVAEMRNPHLQA